RQHLLHRPQQLPTAHRVPRWHMTNPVQVPPSRRDDRRGGMRSPSSDETSLTRVVDAMVAAALASVLLTGCGFLLFGERDTGEIVVDNRTDVPLTVTYRGRFVERVPAQSVHSMYPGPVEDGGCLIAPLVVRDESR